MSSHPLPARLLVACVFAAMACLAACSSSGVTTNGESAKSASQIFADARQATETASSVHISGHITSGTDNVGLDFVDSAAGRGGGTISEKGVTFQLIVSGKTVYLRGSAATFSKIAGTAAGQLLGNKWLQTTTADKDFGSLGTLFDLPKLIQGIRPQGSLRKGSVTTVDGQSVIALTDTSRKGTLYVADTGRPYMVELLGGPGDTGMITFDEYGTATAPATPRGAINLDQLQGS